jgi:hypothetical protein
MISASIFGSFLLLKNLMFLLPSPNSNPWLKFFLVAPLNPFKLMEGESSLPYKNSYPLMASLTAKLALTHIVKMEVSNANIAKLLTLALPFLHTLMFPLFIGTRPFKPPVFSLIDFLQASTAPPLPMNYSFISLPTVNFSKSLAVSVGPTSALIIATNLLSAQSHVSFLVTAHPTTVTNVSILLLIESILPDMLSSMNQNSYSKPVLLPQHLQ